MEDTSNIELQLSMINDSLKRVAEGIEKNNQNQEYIKETLSKLEEKINWKEIELISDDVSSIEGDVRCMAD